MIVVKVDHQMFFKKSAAKTAIKSSSTVALEQLDAGRDEIKQRLAKIDEVNLTLCEAARQTQEASIETAEKMNRKMKIPKRSLREISAKLHEGLVLINHAGEIIHINREGSKILGMDENEIIGKKMGEIITCANPIHDAKGTLVEKPILRTEFFPTLSKKIFEKLNFTEHTGKYVVCNDVLKDELPFCFDHESDRVLGVAVHCGSKSIHNMMVTFTVIDNDPDSIADITYLFLFSTSA